MKWSLEEEEEEEVMAASGYQGSRPATVTRALLTVKSQGQQLLLLSLLKRISRSLTLSSH